MKTLVLQQGLRLRQAELSARVNENGFRKFFKFSATFAGVLLLSGVAMFNVNSPTVPKAHGDFAPVAVATSTSPSVNSSMLGINIANNGSILLRGASVLAISGDTIKTSISWGSANFVWTIETSMTTKFINQKGQKQTISDLKVGDIVIVTGKLINDGSQFAIDAEFVREQ